MTNNSFEGSAKASPAETPYELPYRVDSMVYRRMEEKYGKDISALDDVKLAEYEREIQACENDIQIRRSELDRGEGRPDENYDALNEVADDLQKLHSSPVRAEMQKRGLLSAN